MTAAEIHFSKLCCGGNDFIVVDALKHNPPTFSASRIQELCARRTGIGADGLIILSADSIHPFRITLFNADGSRAAVSYNGSRCAAHYAHRHGIAGEEFGFATEAGIINVRISGSEVTLMLPAPEDISLNKQLEHDGERISGHLLKVGVPYFVVFRDGIYDRWTDTVPMTLRTHRDFPDGANVAVARFDKGGRLEARFFERGVDQETMSSGTGCVAVALTAALVFGKDRSVSVHTAGGTFEVQFEKSAATFSNLTSAGVVDYVYEGTVRLL